MPSCGACVTRPKWRKHGKSETECLGICTKLSWLNGLSSAITRKAARVGCSGNSHCVRTAFFSGFQTPTQRTHLPADTRIWQTFFIPSRNSLLSLYREEAGSQGETLTIEISVSWEQSALVSLNAAWLTLCSARQLIKNGTETASQGALSRVGHQRELHSTASQRLQAFP